MSVTEVARPRHYVDDAPFDPGLTEPTGAERITPRHARPLQRWPIAHTRPPLIVSGESAEGGTGLEAVV